MHHNFHVVPIQFPSPGYKYLILQCTKAFDITRWWVKRFVLDWGSCVTSAQLLTWALALMQCRSPCSRASWQNINRHLFGAVPLQQTWIRGWTCCSVWNEAAFGDGLQNAFVCDPLQFPGCWFSGLKKQDSWQISHWMQLMSSLQSS